jgi:hypothetical protein
VATLSAESRLLPQVAELRTKAVADISTKTGNISTAGSEVIYMAGNEGKNLHFSMLWNVCLGNDWQSRRITFLSINGEFWFRYPVYRQRSLCQAGQKLSRRCAPFALKPDSREWQLDIPNIALRV